MDFTVQDMTLQPSLHFLTVLPVVKSGAVHLETLGGSVIPQNP